MTSLDYEKLLGKIQAMPWRTLAVLGSIAFVGATLLSSVTSVLMMPQFSTAVPTADSGMVVADDSGFNKMPLTDAELKVIYDRNIFNRDGQLGDADPDAAGEATGSEAQKSDLPLRVTGIIYGGTPYNGLVTIENTQNSKTNSFVVGDTLVREAVLAEIHRSRIFIERGKRREYLDLETPEIVRSQRQKKVAPVSAGGSAPIATGPALAKFKEEGFERDGGEMVMSQEYKQRMILGDLTKVLQDAKAVPNMVDNQIRGFRLERIRENSVYQKAGFQNGDVVEEINGVQLNDPGSAIKQLRMVQNESEIEVTVNRNGTPMTMKLKVQ